MNMPWPDRGVAFAARAVASAAGMVRGPRLSTLIFHRVLRQQDPIFPLEMEAARFERLMRIVARTFHVLALHEAVVRLQQGTLPPLHGGASVLLRFTAPVRSPTRSK